MHTGATTAVAASEPRGVETPTWFPLRKISAARFRSLFARILPINRRVTSPTAIGRTSSGLSFETFLRATSLAPAKKRRDLSVSFALCQ